MPQYLYFLLFFSLFSFVSWNYFGLIFILNIVILFYIIDLTKNKNLIKKGIFIFPFFLSFNICATFWLYESDKFYSLITFFTNSIIMTFFFLCGTFFTTKNKKNVFIITWLISEWILTKWDLAWPWLIFGNVLSNQWYLIQWYSICGVHGGSLWLLLIGLFLYKIIINVKKTKTILIILCFLCIIPLLSLFYYLLTKSENRNKKNENFIIYTPKQTKIRETNYNKTRKMLSILNNEKIKTKDKIIVPELFFTISPYDITDGNLHYLFENYLKKNDVTFIIGSEIRNDSTNKFNGISIINNKDVLFRTKKKYVPITEYTPIMLVPFFGKSFYTKNRNDDSKKIFEKLNFLPFVCYEILFSDFIAEKSYNSNTILVLASEEFMNKSYFGSMQYNNLIRLRAIENNRYLVKNSYCGKSLVINPKGDIIENKTSLLFQTNISISNKNTLFQKIVHSIYQK